MRVTSKVAIPLTSFDIALRSLQTGGITYRAFLDEVNQMLASGAAPAELKERLRQRETIEPLPEQTRIALVFHLETWSTQFRDKAAPVASNDVLESDDHTRAPTEADTIVLEEEAAIAAVDRTGIAAADEAAPSAGTPVFSAGDVLGGRFTLVELIGEGGMSRVYKAVDSQAATDSPGRFIALKVLTRPIVESSAVFDAVRLEVGKLATLAHPNIVRIHECGRESASLFITMDLLGGDSLYTALRAGASLDGVAIIKAIAAALDYAHGHDVVHGDLKPGNVMLTVEPKVIDFGIAALVVRPQTALERREAAQTRGALAVTPRYASPQLMARSAPTPADDVYALACIAYEVLTGVHPFDSGPDGQALTYPPRERPGLTSSQYAAIVEGLQFERHNRTSSVQQFLARFERAERPERAERREAEPASAKSTRWVIAAAVVVVVAAVVGWTYLHPSRPAAPVVATTPAPEPTAAAPAPALASQLERPGTVLRDCDDCAPMTVLPAGSFLQGATSGDGGAAPADKPSHAVTIGAPVVFAINDVTVAEFAEFSAATGRDLNGCDIYDGSWHAQPAANWNNPGFAQTADHPVTCVSWRDAVAYAEWLSARHGHVYRLPSASEWEYASRGGLDTTRPWNFNPADACLFANVADASAARRYPGWNVFACNDGYVHTSPVGSFQANAFGLRDMLGNVFQWTQDCWHADYADAPNDGSARMDGGCQEHELRGGSWFSNAKFLSASHRNRFAAEYRTSSVGFRLVRSVGQ